MGAQSSQVSLSNNKGGDFVGPSALLCLVSLHCKRLLSHKHANGKELQTQGRKKKFTDKKGTLFLHHRSTTLTLTNGSKVNVRYVRRRHFYPGDGTPKTDGHVFANDVVVWPGKPKYDVDIS